MNDAEIEALLGGAFSSVAPATPNGKRSWVLTPSVAERRTRVGITMAHGWASLQMREDRTRWSAALDALSGQSAWPGGVKHCTAEGCSILRADVPLTVDTSAGRAWVVRQLRASLEGMLIAAGHDCGSQPPSRDYLCAQDPERLALACSGGGWKVVVKPEGAVRVDLEVRGVRRSVLLEAGDAAIRASVTLAAGALARASAPCRAAAGVFLMRATAALRWARAFASSENGQLESAGFECSIAAPPEEQPLLLAVDALVAACELFGREAEALLEHPEIAACYLEHASPAGREARNDPTSTGAAASAIASSRAAYAAIA